MKALNERFLEKHEKGNKRVHDYWELPKDTDHLLLRAVMKIILF